MKWPKIILNYTAWVLFALLVGGGLFCQIAVVGNRAGQSLVIAGLICGMYLLLSGIMTFALRKLYLFREDMGNRMREQDLILEVGFGVLVFALFFFLRRNCFSAVGDNSDYFFMAQVTGDFGFNFVSHGAEYLYVAFIHLFFRLFGNNISIAVFLQLVLQFVTIVCLWMGVEKAYGKLPSYAVSLVLAISPAMVKEVSVLTPRVLFFAMFAIIYWILTGFLGKDHFWVPVHLVRGMLVGILCCFDLLGIILMVVLCSFSLGGKIKATVKQRIFFLLYGFVGFFAGFFGGCFVWAFCSNNSLGQILTSWSKLYAIKTCDLQFLSFFSGNELLMIAFVTLLGLGIYSFFIHPDGYEIAISVFSCCLVMLGAFGGMLTKELHGMDICLMFLGILMGIGMQRVLERPTKRREYAFAEDTVTVVDSKSAELVMTSKSANPESALKTEPAKKEESHPTQYIENPLPLPKKHEKHAFDFDYDVSDDDDFDH